jgi:hypothetical protein
MEDVVAAMTGALGHLSNGDRENPAAPEGEGR